MSAQIIATGNDKHEDEKEESKVEILADQEMVQNEKLDQGQKIDLSSIDQLESDQLELKEDGYDSDESIINEFDIQLSDVNKKKKEMRGLNDIEK